jgi:hypothetical protein
MTFVFVGERQSPLAARKGWQWADGRVCAGTLHRALEEAGVAPEEQRWLNLWSAPGLGTPQEPAQTDAVKEAAREGLVVVALGRRVARTLQQAEVPHRVMIHPAARGAIRARERYHAHVREVITCEGD